MIERNLTPLVRDRFQRSPFVTVTGPRQSGKTTLCRAAFPDLTYVSLEAPDLRAHAQEDPRGFLEAAGTPAILDEIQRVPDLLSYLQVQSDERGDPGQYVLTGSKNFTLLRGLSQSLAGRTAIFHLLPLGFDELQGFEDRPTDLNDVLFHGSYPRIFDRGLDPAEWYADHVTTYVERDLRQVHDVRDLLQFRTFLGLCAGRSGGLLNLSSLGGDCGVDGKTVKAWIAALEASFLALRLPPLHRNLRKRLTRSPKLYFYDTGLLCHLLGIRSAEQIRTHPLRGAIFETWVVGEILKARYHHGVRGGESFYRDHSGHEVDVVLSTAELTTAVEVKAGRTISSEFLGPLHRFRDLMQAAEPPERVETVLVYGGDQESPRSGTRLVPWASVASQRWADC